MNSGHDSRRTQRDSAFDGPYGGQYGGYENSREPRSHSQSGGNQRNQGSGGNAFRQDWYSAEGAMEASGGHHGHQFGGYGDYETRRGGSQDDRQGGGLQQGGPWQQRGQVPNQFSRDDQYRSSAAQGRHFDPDYAQWRHEQMQQLDEDFEAYRRERYGRFAEDFNAWRAKRSGSSASSSSQGDGESDEAGQTASKQQQG